MSHRGGNDRRDQPQRRYDDRRGRDQDRPRYDDRNRDRRDYDRDQRRDYYRDDRRQYGDNQRGYGGNQRGYHEDNRGHYYEDDRRNYQGGRGGYHERGRRDDFRGGRRGGPRGGRGGYEGSEQKFSQFEDQDAIRSKSDIQFRVDNQHLMTDNEKKIEDDVVLYTEKVNTLATEKRSMRRFEKANKAMILPPFSPGEHRGKSGRPVRLLTNSFEVTDQSRIWSIYVYNIKFQHPDYTDRNFGVPSASCRRLLNENFGEEFNGNYVFDGRETLYSTIYIDEKIERQCVLDQRQFTVTMMFTKKACSNELPALQAMNVMMKRVYKLLGMEPIANSFFDTSTKGRIPITNRVDALSSVKSSVSYYEGNVLLYLLDIHYKFEQTETMNEVISQMKRENMSNDTINDNLKGRTLRTTYNNMTYSIIRVAFDMTPNDTFECNDGQVSYAQYVERYKLRVSDFNQPMLVVLNKKKGEGFTKEIFLIPQFCRLTGLPKSMLENLNAAKKASDMTKAVPAKRVELLRAFRKRLGDKEEVQKELSKLGLSFGNDLIQLTGRHLEMPAVYFDAWRSEDRANRTCTFGGAIFKYKLLNPPVIGKGVDVVCQSAFEHYAGGIMDELRYCLNKLGMGNAKSNIHYLDTHATEAYCRKISELHGKTDLVICILPNNNSSRYNSIKIQSTIITPVPTQVLLERNFNRPDKLRTMVMKVMPQMAAKLRGEPWGCKIPSSLKTSTMFVGIDTYHDAARKDKSAAAFVASLNGTCTRMFSRVSYQLKSHELHVRMRPNVAEACIHWYRANGAKFPSHIIIYRDGVGDGQLQDVVEMEIEQVKWGISDAIDILKIEPTQPTLTFIVVKKRISQRFFLSTDQGFENPAPGTVIDTKVTRSDWHDFYLVSHMPREGTVNPVHYNVIYDTLNMSSDDIQQLTYRLCWLYYNYTGSISIPSVCGFAHKLAYISGMSLSSSQAISASPELSDSMFYL